MLARPYTCRVPHSGDYFANPMLEAQITSPRGSLYIGVDATPYDVQELRSHVLALETPTAGDVRLTLRLTPETRACIGTLVTALAQKLASKGFCVTVDDERVVSDGARRRPALRAPQRPRRRARRSVRR